MSVIIALLGLFAVADSNQELAEHRIYRNDEFGIEISVLRDLNVCPITSGSHPQGFYVWLDRLTICHAPPDHTSNRKINILGQYNSSFAVSPAVHLPCTPVEVSDSIKSDSQNLSFSDSKSLWCRKTYNDGITEYYVTTQGGRRRLPHDSPEMATARTHYYAVLRTTEHDAAADLNTFRRFLRNVRLRPEVTDEQAP
jgi:hypothetical protein